MSPLWNVLGHAENDLGALVDGPLDVLEGGVHEDVGDGQDDVGLEHRWLLFMLVVQLGEPAGDLNPALDEVQREAGACGVQGIR